MESFVACQIANHKEARLPSKTEANPKQCGAVTVLVPSEINGVTTRTGKFTTTLARSAAEDGILPKPATYVKPHLRRNATEGEIQPRTVKDTQECSDSVVNSPMSNKPKAPHAAVPVEIDLSKDPFPHRIEKTKEDKHFNKFLEIMKDVQVTILMLDAVLHVPMYAKFFKDLMSKKISIDDSEVVTLTKECSAVIQNIVPQKLEDPGSFCIPCLIGNRVFNTLCDLGSSVSVLAHSLNCLMPLGDL
jgi:hypothetical protein